MSRPSSPAEISIKMMFWMVMMPYFIGQTVTDFWRPCTYTQAMYALLALVITCRLCRPWLPVPYYIWWHENHEGKYDVATTEETTYE